MRFIQMHQTVANHDAIGNDIEIISGILGENHESLVYAENKFNKRVEYVSDELIDEYLQDEKTVVIYHHSVFWQNGFEKINSAKAKVIFRYHNITPEKFFELYCDSDYQQCFKGRKQTLEFIKSKPDSFWFCDSTFNSYDLTGVPKDKIKICAPFNKLEEWGKVVPNEEMLKDLVESTTKNILFVGRVVPNKGHLMLLDILRCYTDYYGKDIKLRIIGKFFDELEDYNDIVKSKIEEYGLKDNIEFIGEVNDSTLMTYYLGSDVMLVCSEHEGFCVPVTEAQFFGLPVIALAECAVPETIGKNQLLLSGDIHEYAAAIKIITENEEYRKYLEEKGLDNYKDRFSFEKIKENFIKGLSEMGVEI
ncbi:MAG: glycosyltransferase family 4 protein [Lachnospiraceae bacterium]|nr:glycosyltransferase family 4 protein [Lachnospiraceae bacterium]